MQDFELRAQAYESLLGRVNYLLNKMPDIEKMIDEYEVVLKKMLKSRKVSAETILRA